MHNMELNWKIFKNHLPEWRERYLENTISDIRAMLSSKTKTATELFWEVNTILNKEIQILTDCFDGYSRSNINIHLILLYKHNIINDNDLNEFDEELCKLIIESSKI